MKILHINSSDTGGAAIACIRQHLALLEYGVDSYILTFNKTRNDLPNHLSYVDLQKLPIGELRLFPRFKGRLKYEYDKRWNNKEIRYAKNLEALQLEASRVTDSFSLIKTPYRIDLVPGIEEYDIINLHWAANFLDWESFFASPKIKNIVWVLHDMHPFTGGYHYAAGYEGYKQDDADPPFLQNTFNPGFAKEQLEMKKKILSDTKVKIKIASPSKWLFDCSRQSSLFSNFENYYLPYSLNTKTFKHLDKFFARRALNIPQDKKVILFVSYFIHNERKGLPLLLEALSMLNDNNRVLCCIGNSSNLNISNNQIIQLGNILDERVMALAYNAADVFILPSKEDNMPNVILESLCCGTPVIGFKIGGMPDMIIDGVNGVLCHPIMANELKNSIQEVLNNLQNFDKESISENAAAKYSPEIQAKAFINLYKSFK